MMKSRPNRKEIRKTPRLLPFPEAILQTAPDMEV